MWKNTQRAGVGYSALSQYSIVLHDVLSVDCSFKTECCTSSNRPGYSVVTVFDRAAWLLYCRLGAAAQIDQSLPFCRPLRSPRDCETFSVVMHQPQEATVWYIFLSGIHRVLARGSPARRLSLSFACFFFFFCSLLSILAAHCLVVVY